MSQLEISSKIYTTPAFCRNTLSLAHVCIKVPENFDYPHENKYHLVLIVDCSDSMIEVIDNVKSTILAIFNRIRDSCNITVITFSRYARIIYSDLNNKREEFESIINKIQADGLTNLYDGLRLAFSVSSDFEDKTLMILLSDGNPTIGIKNNSTILKLVSDNSNSLHILNTIGYGVDYNPYLLNKIGHFTYIKNIESMPKVIGSMINMIESTFATDIEITLDEKLNRKAIGKNKFNPLFKGRIYNYAVYLNSEQIEMLKNGSLSKDIKIQYIELSGTRHDILTEFQFVEQIPSELKKLYYENQANKLIYRLQEENPTEILKRINSWKDEGKEAAEKVRSAALQGYNYYTHASMLSTFGSQIAYRREYDSGFITESQLRLGEELSEEYSRIQTI